MAHRLLSLGHGSARTVRGLLLLRLPIGGLPRSVECCRACNVLGTGSGLLQSTGLRPTHVEPACHGLLSDLLPCNACLP